MKSLASCLVSVVSLALVAAATPAAHAATFSCSTVVRNPFLDPDGKTLSRTFGLEVGVNSAGDTLFTARPFLSRENLYLYPAAGTPEVIAYGNGAAPNGDTFRPTRPFASPSINDAGDVAFYGRLRAGRAVLVRPSAGPLAIAAASGGTSPAGGNFDDFPGVATIDPEGKVAFIATVAGGPSGVFVHDSATATTTAAILAGDTTLAGRQLCEFHTLGLASGSVVAVRASSRASCANAAEPLLDGIFVATPGGIRTAALEGDASPIAGTTYTVFSSLPSVLADAKVAFRASVAGAAAAEAIFVADTATASTSVAVRRNEPSVVGGVVGRMYGYRLTPSGEIVLRSNLQGSDARHGILLYDGTPEPILLRAIGSPPTDQFGVGARFGELLDPALSADGDTLAVEVSVTDVTAPRSRRGVVRCTR